MSNFSFSPSVFFPYGEISTIFIKIQIVVCELSVLEESKICCLLKA